MQELNKIQTEAAKIVTGVTKLVSLHALFDEVNWEPLAARRMKHILLLVYKMFKQSLSSISFFAYSPNVNTLSQNNPRNAQNIQTIDSRTTQYFNSFSPPPH